MRRGLELRVRALEAAVPDEAKVRKPPFPQWLLDAWQESGQQLDRSDGDALRQHQPGQLPAKGTILDDAVSQLRGPVSAIQEA